jgi:hypothetical protein
MYFNAQRVRKSTGNQLDIRTIQFGGLYIAKSGISPINPLLIQICNIINEDVKLNIYIDKG